MRRPTHLTLSVACGRCSHPAAPNYDAKGGR